GRLDRFEAFGRGDVGERRDRRRGATVVRAAALRGGGAIGADVEIFLHVALAGASGRALGAVVPPVVGRGVIVLCLALDVPAVAGLVGREHRHEHGGGIAKAYAGVCGAALGGRVVDVVGVGACLH